jgi:HD-GYP domain-containing protein (c-di-GMP phosphodiesterase class II)
MDLKDIPSLAPLAALHPVAQASAPEGLNERIRVLHQRICAAAPGVARVACALYEPDSGLLKTLAHSTCEGKPLTGYQFALAQSPSLLSLARERRTRVIDDIPAMQPGQSEHSRWLREQGYQSSYTVPLEHNGEFDGFVFFDSREPAYFSPAITAQLDIYGQLVALMISHELLSIRALVGSVKLAREFAHLRDIETGVHLDRMAHYVRLIAQGVAVQHRLSDEFIELLFLFAPLHDLGKVGVPDEVLLKPAPLSPDERRTMQAHVDKGSVMVARLLRSFRLDAMSGVSVLRNLVASHHELMDGSGYPRGLRGEAIPIEARIVAVADVFDALTSQRPYKDAWPLQRAYDALEAMAQRGQLDADCVRALQDGVVDVLAIMARFAE